MSPDVQRELARIRAIPNPSRTQCPPAAANPQRTAGVGPKLGPKTRRPGSRVQAILAAVGEAGALSAPAIAKAIGVAPRHIYQPLECLVSEGRLVRFHPPRGAVLFRLPEGKP